MRAAQCQVCKASEKECQRWHNAICVRIATKLAIGIRTPAVQAGGGERTRVFLNLIAASV